VIGLDRILGKLRRSNTLMADTQRRQHAFAVSETCLPDGGTSLLKHRSGSVFRFSFRSGSDCSADVLLEACRRDSWREEKGRSTAMFKLKRAYETPSSDDG
jgi:hypothetical protein